MKLLKVENRAVLGRSLVKYNFKNYYYYYVFQTDPFYIIKYVSRYVT